jgi:Ser/Thr protein kinase RdoA (MazF antagonist)
LLAAIAAWGQTLATLHNRHQVHGDPGCANVVVARNAGRGWQAWLIDVDSAGRGDASWDLASAYDSLLPYRARLGGLLRPALRALLDGYRGSAGPGQLSGEVLKARAALICVQVSAAAKS